MALVDVPSIPIQRADLDQNASALFPVPLHDLGVFDAFQTPLPAAGASDDLGLYGGTHGTNFPYVGTGDVKAATTTRKARFTITLPPNYVPAGNIFIRAKAGMVTTVSDTSATIDFAAYKANGPIITGSDLVTTSAQSVNSLTWANKDFALDASGLNPGDELDVLITIAVTDAATATAVIGAFRVLLGCTIYG